MYFASYVKFAQVLPPQPPYPSQTALMEIVSEDVYIYLVENAIVVQMLVKS